MVVKYSKVIIMQHPISGDPVTILVEYAQSDSFKGISIESLEGEYASSEEFEKAYKQAFNGDEAKIWNFIPMTLDDAKRLYTVLGGAIEKSEEARASD